MSDKYEFVYTVPENDSVVGNVTLPKLERVISEQAEEIKWLLQEVASLLQFKSKVFEQQTIINDLRNMNQELAREATK